MLIVVVGGAGFIGSHLVDRLLAEGETVDVVDDLSSGSLANLALARSGNGSLKVHHLDIAAPEFDTLLGMRKPDVVYHLAAIPPAMAGAADLGTRLTATMTLMEACERHRVTKVVVPMPAALMYGRPMSRDLPVKEAPPTPHGRRGIIACATAALLDHYRERSAIEFSVPALAHVYGSRERADGGVVARFITAAASGVAPVFRGDGRQTRDFIFVDDAVDALAAARNRGGGLVINIGTGVQTTVRDLWKVVAPDSVLSPRVEPPHRDELQRFALAPVRARIHLSWAPWTSLADGLAQLGDPVDGRIAAAV